MLPEVRMARIIDAIGLHRAKQLSCCEAGEMPGLSERHFRRLRDVYEAEGAEGIVDRRRGRASGRRAPVDEIEWVVAEFRTRDFDFTAKYFHEAVMDRPMAGGTAFKRSYTWTKSVLQWRGLLTKAPKRSVHRKKRVRRPLLGMMLFQDGSRHAWLPSGPELDLIVVMDDATSRILSIVLVEEEGTASTFHGLHEVIRQHGLFSSFYTDRGSHYFVTAQAGGKVDRSCPTQVGRALEQFGIEHITSYSPEGRGRMERVWGTLQKRLPPLLRIAAPADLAAADRWLRDVYMAQHNAPPISRVSPLRGKSLWTAWTRLRLDHPAHRKTQQKKRTFDVLPNRTSSEAIDRVPALWPTWPGSPASGRPTAMPTSMAFTRAGVSSRRRAGRMCGKNSSTSMPPPQRRARSTPLAKALRTWAEATVPQLSGRSDLAGAFRSMLTRWTALTRAFDDGRIALDNNPAEPALRSVAIGRKNYLFAGSDRGAERAAALYSLIETAKLDGLDPKARLRDVLGRIADHPAAKLADLLPWRWTPPQPAAQAARHPTGHSPTSNYPHFSAWHLPRLNRP